MYNNSLVNVNVKRNRPLSRYGHDDFQISTTLYWLRILIMFHTEIQKVDETTFAVPCSQKMLLNCAKDFLIQCKKSIFENAHIHRCVWITYLSRHFPRSVAQLENGTAGSTRREITTYTNRFHLWSVGDLRELSDIPTTPWTEHWTGEKRSFRWTELKTTVDNRRIAREVRGWATEFVNKTMKSLFLQKKT